MNETPVKKQAGNDMRERRDPKAKFINESQYL
jgi:hypothetical protein